MTNKIFTCPHTGRKTYLRMYSDNTFYFWYAPRKDDLEGRRPTTKEVEAYYKRLQVEAYYRRLQK